MGGQHHPANGTHTIGCQLGAGRRVPVIGCSALWGESKDFSGRTGNIHFSTRTSVMKTLVDYEKNAKVALFTFSTLTLLTVMPLLLAHD